MIINWPNLTAVGFDTKNPSLSNPTFWAYSKEYYFSYSNTTVKQVLNIDKILTHVKRF